MTGACASQEDQISLPYGATTGDEPGDEALFQSIAAYIASEKGPPNSRYEYSRVDLNGDGRRDGLVLFNLPYSHWCGWGGCTMIVFEAGSDSFSVRSEIANVRGPIVVADTVTAGWRDLAVRLSGTHMADRNILMRFDGQTYPPNPLYQTEIAQGMTDIPGMMLFP